MKQIEGCLGQRILANIQNSLSARPEFVVLKSTTPHAKWECEDVRILLKELFNPAKHWTAEEKLNSKLYAVILKIG